MSKKWIKSWVVMVHAFNSNTRGQRQVIVCELETSLLYNTSITIGSKTTQGNPDLKKKCMENIIHMHVHFTSEGSRRKKKMTNCHSFSLCISFYYSIYRDFCFKVFISVCMCLYVCMLGVCVPISAKVGLWISLWFQAAIGGFWELNSGLFWKGS